MHSCVSCSVPVVFSPSQLRAKDPLTGEIVPWHDDGHHYIDGSVDGDVPTTRLAEMFNVNHFIVSQVNPHVVPFLSKDEGPGEDPNRRSWLTTPLLQTMTGLARDEMLHRMAVMTEMGIFPNTSTKLASILSQKYSGDINILPDISYASLSHILQNPTAEFMRQACLSGERATWPKIARIRNHVAIELALDRAVQTMRARVALSPTVRAGLGIHMGETPWQSNWETSRVSHRRTRRRGSSGQEPERGRPGRLSSSRRPSIQLRRARSMLFMECAHPERPVSPVPLRSKHHMRRSTELRVTTAENTPSVGSSYYIVGTDSDDDSSGHGRRSVLVPASAARTPSSSSQPSSPRSTRSNPRSRQSSVPKGRGGFPS